MPVEHSRTARGTRVLVVDDDPSIRTIIRDTLEVAGCDVALAGNGLEALEAARLLPPDVIVLDVLMPVMSGTEFLGAYQAEFACKAAPVIMMTALSGASRAGLPRPAALLRKPFDLDALVEVVTSVADSHAVERAPGTTVARI
jgi:CheY-like chemotaxis protein